MKLKILRLISKQKKMYPSIVLILYFSALNEIQSQLVPYIQSPLVTNWGDWYHLEKCSPNSYVIGFQTKVEESCGSCDDTAMNGRMLRNLFRALEINLKNCSYFFK